MRTKIVAGNWKMNKNAEQTEDLLNELIDQLPSDKEVKIIVAPTFVNLSSAVEHLNFTNITVAAQNMHQAEGGAFTGEISADMLKSIGVNTVILGHSERRAYCHETDALLANKVDTALKHEMDVIFCFGEELKDRQDKQHFNVVENQLRDGLFHIEKSSWEHIILAYEPVWAIGTGETASPEQAQEMHEFIRATIRKGFGADIAEGVSILYGGSVKPDNAKEIFSKPDVDGGLIGGAALKASDFVAIVNGI
ncbi:triose-phosphate isomerase [Flavobacterium branchiophilum NBRC 15030 = ATCC 35035]|uniref:Triosephosphate isomerase n=2 Tax=Flavobacterium branchiophilum TaxID=55197 RepID=G2Z790_FLABF|nr:triose-phosphate isomerase [Flavobacterium branchiophilum]OXA75618.1 triose-phosphate isomerase [Flavobacterium branchiophilum NBRC 15030 = ATCC 35035]PDS22018.1 triose-phosphate isomerase [Flavobacterium branchiophilum]TQM41724.1 triosephosphate isomerase [Flavobacterium branchiophilum]CCB69304.1 Triose-phosphate isomerase [Flavobacterium branchiophilum FL-15]GEM55448.1 triosephosphate isomerase [Flavobacterium branchiophilum NBRC 15030 = ATCC 35035]